MSIYPSWRRDSNVVGKKLDPVWTVADGRAWDHEYGRVYYYIRGDVGDYPYGGSDSTIRNYASSGSTSVTVGTSNTLTVNTTDYLFGSGSLAYTDGPLGPYIRAPTASTFDYTIEGWFKPQSSVKATFGLLNGYVLLTLSNEAIGGSIKYVIFAPLNLAGTSTFFVSTDLTSTYTLPAGQWTHVAWQRGNLGTDQFKSLRIFINGSLDSEIFYNGGGGPSFDTSGHSFLGPTTVSNFNWQSNGYDKFVGSVDEFRITGVTRYHNSKFLPQKFMYGQSSTIYNGTFLRFLPDSSFDSYYQYNRLLLPMNGSNNSTTVIDNSGWSNTITALGGAKLSTTEAKFGSTSLDLNTANSRLEINTTTAQNCQLQITRSPFASMKCVDFTVECWVYITQANNRLALATSYQNDDIYRDQTTVLFHFDAHDYTGSTIEHFRNEGNPAQGAVTCDTVSNFSPSIVGTSRFGNAFDASDSTDSITINGEGIRPLLSDFTLEFSILTQTTTTDVQIDLFRAGASTTLNGLSISYKRLGGLNVFKASLFLGLSEYIIGTSTGLNPSVFHDLAVTRSGNIFRFFVDGTLIGSLTNTASVNNINYFFGGVGTNTAVYDELRFTKACRYTASYSVATEPFPNPYLRNINAFVLKNGATIKTVIGEYNKNTSAAHLEATDQEVPANQWAHVSWSHVDGELYMHVNGLLAGNYLNFDESDLLRIIGGQYNGGGIDNDFGGYIDDLRVTIGEGRYFSANFTPPEYPNMIHPG